LLAELRQSALLSFSNSVLLQQYQGGLIPAVGREEIEQ
jgi:hypothetical protein